MPAPNILAKKKDIVAKLTEELKEAKSIVFFAYQGLSVDQDTDMRRGFREEEVQYKVMKNAYVKRALDALNIEFDEADLFGPTAIAYSTKDVVSAPRLCKKYAEEYKSTKIKGGVVEGAKTEIDTINKLADIPSREVLYGQLLMGLLFPLTKTAMVLKAMGEKAQELNLSTVGELAQANRGAKNDAPAEEVAASAEAEAPQAKEALAEGSEAAPE